MTQLPLGFYLTLLGFGYRAAISFAFTLTPCPTAQLLRPGNRKFALTQVPVIIVSPYYNAMEFRLFPAFF